MSRRNEALGLCTLLGAVVGAGVLGALATRPALKPWYADLKKPPLTPPNFVFAPVWTALYGAMAVSSWLVWKSPDGRKNRALAWFGGQMLLNLLWTPIFFWARKPGIALLDLLLLNAAIAQTVNRFRTINRKTTVLLRPYQAWVAFATYLNAGLCVLNLRKFWTKQDNLEAA